MRILDLSKKKKGDFPIGVIINRFFVISTNWSYFITSGDSVAKVTGPNGDCY